MTWHIWQVIDNDNTSPLHLHNITILAWDQQKRHAKKEENNERTLQYNTTALMFQANNCWDIG